MTEEERIEFEQRQYHRKKMLLATFYGLPLNDETRHLVDSVDTAVRPRESHTDNNAGKDDF